jgi:hypothetical protein
MMSQPYVDGITDTVAHAIASSLTAIQVAAEQDTLTFSVVCPDRWFLGDFAVVTSRDGRAFAGEVESIDVCTGEVTIRGPGQLSVRAAPLRVKNRAAGPPPARLPHCRAGQVRGRGRTGDLLSSPPGTNACETAPRRRYRDDC